jgi:2-polyprenyl-6-hydroxyphenyl methylase/3-demethylubiquinone-9 3-methyltransferase
VTAVDLTPELLAVGRDRAGSAGVEVRWVEADAEELPFPAASFDMVLSAIGAMFAPDHARTASELLRVCRPGGTLALANWTPDGYGGAFFALLAGYAPPPPDGGTPPTACGDPRYVHQLLGDAVDDLRCVARTLTLDFTGQPAELSEIYRTCFGPVLATRDALAGDVARLAAFDRDLLAFLRTENRDGGSGPDEGHYEFEYLAVTATRRS